MTETAVYFLFLMVHRLRVKTPMDFTTGNELRALRPSSSPLWNVTCISQPYLVL